jgi:hypothetical protein
MPPRRNNQLDLLTRMAPDPTALLSWLAPRVTDRMLYTTSELDYGHEAEKYLTYLTALRKACARGDDSLCKSCEVLEFAKWSDIEPGFPAWHRRDAHTIRTFACAVLLRAEAVGTENWIGASQENVARVVAGVIELGSEAESAALRYLSWHALRLTWYDHECVFVALAILLLAVRLRRDEHVLRGLCRWVYVEEQRCRGLEWRGRRGHDRWLLGLGSDIGSTHAIWAGAARRVLLESELAVPPDLRLALVRLGRRLQSQAAV